MAPAARGAVARSKARAADGSIAWAWVAVGAWLAFVFSASSEAFAASHTVTWLEWGVRLVWGEIGAEALDMANAIVRKVGHFVEYAILCLLTFRALRLSLHGWTARAWAGLALILAVVCAITDETHQSFVPNRTASARDVVLDTFGAASAALLASALHRRRGGVGERARRGERANAL
jgi:VanZ family protein